MCADVSGVWAGQIPWVNKKGKVDRAWIERTPIVVTDVILNLSVATGQLTGTVSEGYRFPRQFGMRYKHPEASPIYEGRVKADSISFALAHPRRLYKGRISGKQIAFTRERPMDGSTPSEEGTRLHLPATSEFTAIKKVSHLK